jgi:hypothetical protein
MLDKNLSDAMIRKAAAVAHKTGTPLDALPASHDSLPFDAASVEPVAHSDGANEGADARAGETPASALHGAAAGFESHHQPPTSTGSSPHPDVTETSGHVARVPSSGGKAAASVTRVPSGALQRGSQGGSAEGTLSRMPSVAGSVAVSVVAPDPSVSHDDSLRARVGSEASGGGSVGVGGMASVTGGSLPASAGASLPNSAAASAGEQRICSPMCALLPPPNLSFLPWEALRQRIVAKAGSKSEILF